jgi:hypothetical protein
VELCPFTALKLTENGEPKTDLIDQQGFPHYVKVAEINPVLDARNKYVCWNTPYSDLPCRDLFESEQRLIAS